MFGITPQPTRNTQNPKEEIRRGINSTTYDSAAAERMKMDHLKKERERREKERNRLTYDSKKREYERLVQDEERMKTESRRLEMELSKYSHEVEGVKLQEKRETSGIPALKKEELELVQKIQKTESELQMFKNRHQRVVQELTRMNLNDRNFAADVHKREAYSIGIKSKYDMLKQKHEDAIKQIEKLKVEVDQLKKII
ncbi:MAG: hypothetical protein V4686_03665 [Patescibacteria group bacterium]